MTTETPTRQITISGHTFEVLQPYTEGHTITEAEARALNQVRAENIRNNMASKVKVAMGDEPTDEFNPDTIAAAVAEYDEGYEFTLASVGAGRRSSDPVEVEALKIARAAVADWAKSVKMTVKALKERIGDDAYNAKVAEIANRDKIVKEAQRRVDARNKQAEAVADSLGLDEFISEEA